MKPKKLLNRNNKMKKNKNNNKINKLNFYIYFIKKYFIFNNYIFLIFFNLVPIHEALFRITKNLGNEKKS